MTALAAVFLRDGRPVERQRFAAVADSLRPFGAQEPTTWRADCTGLAWTASVAALPQDADDGRPVDAGPGRVLLFDGFLDHRADLASALGVAPREGARTSDAALFARAVERWGDDAALRAEGMFTTVLWDADAKVLKAVCAAVNAPPLYFSVNARRGIVATAVRALFAWGDLPRRLDDAYLASTLVLDYGDAHETFYEGVYSLCPGEMLTIGLRGSHRITHYYDLAERARPVRLRKDADYVEAADALWQDAVRSALRASPTPAVLMSGGLDSTAIAATALELLAAAAAAAPGPGPLVSFTAVPEPGWDGIVPPGKRGDESEAVHALAATYPALDARFVDAAGLGPDHAQLRMLELSGIPPRNAGNTYWIHACLRQAAEAGRRFVFSGEGGEFTLSRHGYARLRELLLGGRLPTLWRETAGLPRGRLLGRLSPILGHAVVPSLPYAGKHLYHRMVLGLSWRRYSAVKASFARAMRVDERAREHGLYTTPGRRDVSRRPSDPLRQNARATRRAMEALHGVAFRLPFQERRLTEWCTGVPYGQFLRQGRSRWLIRRLMKDRLPAEILDGPAGLQAADWHLRTTRALPDVRATLERWQGDPAVAERLDLDRLLRLVETWPTKTPLSRRDHPDWLLAVYLERALAAGRLIRWVEGGSNRV